MFLRVRPAAEDSVYNEFLTRVSHHGARRVFQRLPEIAMRLGPSADDTAGGRDTSEQSQAGRSHGKPFAFAWLARTSGMVWTDSD